MSYICQRPVVGRYIKLDQISSGFNGSETSFSMTAGSQAVFPGTARNLLLSLGGVIQEPDTNFTISGSTLTFTTAPVANTTFFAVIFGDMQSTGTPSDGTVLPASIASSGNFSFPQLTVTGTSSLGDDVTFTGANYNVLWDKSDNALEFADNAKARFGTGNDLEIFHDGTNTFMDNSTGIFLIRNTNAEIRIRPVGPFGGTNEESAIFKPNGAVELYHDNSKKFEPTSSGIDVTGSNINIEGGSASLSQLKINSTGRYRGVQLDENGTRKAHFQHDATSNNLVVGTAEGTMQFNSGDTPRVVLNSSGHWVPYVDSTYDLGLNGTRWRNVYADTLYGDGSNLTGITAGAQGGGGESIFFESENEMNNSYTISTNHNALIAGPLTIASGATLTINSPSVVTIP